MEEKNQIPIITLILVAINALVFFYIEWRGSSQDIEYMMQMGAIYEPFILENHEYYRLVTHFFLHFGSEHLINNMLSLLILGYSIESVLGKGRFILLYFLSGILAGVTSIVYNIYVGAEYTVSCGASGAIYGLTGALLILLIIGNRGRRSTEVFRYLLYIGISVYSGMRDVSIDHAAHIGGFVFGALICAIMARKKKMEVSYES